MSIRHILKPCNRSLTRELVSQMSRLLSTVWLQLNDGDEFVGHRTLVEEGDGNARADSKAKLELA